MKPRLMHVFLFAALLVAASVGPLEAQDFDTLYLSHGENAHDNCQYAVFGQFYTMNLVLMDPTSPTSLISGFECRILQAGNVQITGVDFPGQGVNLGTLDNMIVGFSEPLIAQSNVTLATITYFTLETPTAAVTPPTQPDKASPMCSGAASSFWLVPTLKPSLEGMMAYVYPDGTEHILVPAYAIGSGAYPDFLVEIRPVAIDAQTWGSLKALYRTP